MSKARFIIMVLLVGLLISGWSFPPADLGSAAATGDVTISLQAPQAASPTVRLIVSNKTGAIIDRLVLTGPKVYTFTNVPQGNSTYTILKGKYSIQYKACGVNRTKKANILSNFKFSTVSCPTAKISVVNTTGGNLILSLKGPATYRFVIPAGTTRITVLKGSYQFTGSGRCGAHSGTFKAQGRVRWTWWCR